MTVNVQDIRDYITWKQNVNFIGIQDSVEDFAAYRERLNQDQRVENTTADIGQMIINNEEIMTAHLEYLYRSLTGTEFEADDV